MPKFIWLIHRRRTRGTTVPRHFRCRCRGFGGPRSSASCAGRNEGVRTGSASSPTGSVVEVSDTKHLEDDPYLLVLDLKSSALTRLNLKERGISAPTDVSTAATNLPPTRLLTWHYPPGSLAASHALFPVHRGRSILRWGKLQSTDFQLNMPCTIEEDWSDTTLYLPQVHKLILYSFGTIVGIQSHLLLVWSVQRSTKNLRRRGAPNASDSKRVPGVVKGGSVEWTKEGLFWY